MYDVAEMPTVELPLPSNKYTVKVSHLINIQTLEIKDDAFVNLELTPEEVTVFNNIAVDDGKNVTTDYLVWNPGGANQSASYAIFYNSEAKFLYNAIKNDMLSTIKTYINTFIFRSMLTSSSPTAYFESEWGKPKQLRDVQWSALNFKVKLYFGVKNGITMRHITTIHDIHRNPFEVAENFLKANKELLNLLKIIEKANKKADIIYNKFIKNK